MELRRFARRSLANEVDLRQNKEGSEALLIEIVRIDYSETPYTTYLPPISDDVKVEGALLLSAGSRVYALGL